MSLSIKFCPFIQMQAKDTCFYVFASILYSLMDLLLILPKTETNCHFQLTIPTKIHTQIPMTSYVHLI